MFQARERSEAIPRWNFVLDSRSATRLLTRIRQWGVHEGHVRFFCKDQVLPLEGVEVVGGLPVPDDHQGELFP